jgi:general secretion pathway protein G
MKKTKKINKNAFTLVELIVVMLVLAILSTLAFVSYFSYNATSRDSTRKADLKNMGTVLELYKIDE